MCYRIESRRHARDVCACHMLPLALTFIGDILIFCDQYTNIYYLDADTELIRIKAIRSGRVIYINFFEQFTQLRIKRWTLCVCKYVFVHT